MAGRIFAQIHIPQIFEQALRFEFDAQTRNLLRDGYPRADAVVVCGEEILVHNANRQLKFSSWSNTVESVLGITKTPRLRTQ